jgi:hypothetical protein
MERREHEEQEDEAHGQGREQTQHEEFTPTFDFILSSPFDPGTYSCIRASVSSDPGLIRCIETTLFHGHLMYVYTYSPLASLSPSKTGIYNLSSPPRQAPRDIAPGEFPWMEAPGYWRTSAHSTGTRRVSRERRH